MDSAPICILGEELYLITGLTGEGHQLFRQTVVHDLYHTVN